MGQIALEKYDARSAAPKTAVEPNPMVDYDGNDDNENVVTPKLSFDKWIKRVPHGAAIFTQWPYYENGTLMHPNGKAIQRLKKAAVHFDDVFDINGKNKRYVPKQPETAVFASEDLDFLEALHLTLKGKKRAALEKRTLLTYGTNICEKAKLEQAYTAAGFDDQDKALAKKNKFYQIAPSKMAKFYVFFDNLIDDLKNPTPVPNLADGASLFARLRHSLSKVTRMIPTSSNDYEAAELYLKAHKLVDCYDGLEACLKQEIARLKKEVAKKTEAEALAKKLADEAAAARARAGA